MSKKRNWKDIFGADSESEEEEEIEVTKKVERVSKNDALWTEGVVEKKVEKKKKEHSMRDINNVGLVILEEICEQYVMEDMEVELFYIEEKCVLACVLVIQGCWRSWRWKKTNENIVERLKRRGVSRGKMFEKKRKEKSEEMGSGVGEGEESESVWEKRFDEASGNDYFFNLVEGTSSWDRPDDYSGP